MNNRLTTIVQYYIEVPNGETWRLEDLLRSNGFPFYEPPGNIVYSTLEEIEAILERK